MKGICHLRQKRRRKMTCDSLNECIDMVWIEVIFVYYAFWNEILLLFMLHCFFTLYQDITFDIINYVRQFYTMNFLFGTSPNVIMQFLLPWRIHAPHLKHINDIFYNFYRPPVCLHILIQSIHQFSTEFFYYYKQICPLKCFVG